MKILAIETSCDETSLSLLLEEKNLSETVFTVLGDITQTQIDMHREFGGVFPTVAKREHQNSLVPILMKLCDFTVDEIPTTLDNEKINTIKQILDREQPLQELFVQHLLNKSNPGITHICVTSGPGLEPALWVGISFARALGVLWDIPVIPVNHMEGHILSVLAPEKNIPADTHSFTVTDTSLSFPTLALLVSGGHTELVLVHGIGDYKIIGKTVDDAIGEAFDKVARVLGLPYPGGPEISKLAKLYHDNILVQSSPISGTGTISAGNLFPRPMIHNGNYQFSFSGLKTAVLYYVRNLLQGRTDQVLTDTEKQYIAYEFQEAAIDVIIKKTLRAMNEYGIQTIVVGGGVAANTHLRTELVNHVHTKNPPCRVLFPTRELSTDNSLMIGLAGYYKISRDPEKKYETITADGNWELS